MAVYTKLSKEDIIFILSDYQIGNLIEFQGIQDGIENTNYFIKTKKGKFILTIFENRVNSQDIPFFINLMKFLNQNNFISPNPIENINGEILNNLNFINSVNIGLTAGASAPETLVQILISKLKKKFEVNLIDHEVIKEDIVFNLPKILR